MNIAIWRCTNHKEMKGLYQKVKILKSDRLIQANQLFHVVIITLVCVVGSMSCCRSVIGEIIFIVEFILTSKINPCFHFF